MGATFSRYKNWISLENLTDDDLNAEFNNILNNLTPTGIDDHSTSVAQMRLETNPGAQGTESLATSLAGELQRIRYKLRQILGATYWYDPVVISLTEANTLINQISGLPSNRIVSGTKRSTSSQSQFFSFTGANTTLTVLGTGTNLVVRIDGTAYTLTANTNITGLVTAPNTNNTCLVNDSTLSGGYFTQLQGEWKTLTIDTVGTEISSLIGKYAAFKIVNGGNTEYFTAFVRSGTELTDVRRGYFFNSAGSPVTRITIADNDTITLMKLTWIFMKTDLSFEPVYTNPTYSTVQPSSPSTGDYWFDMINNTWKRFSGSAWVAANAHLIGVCIQDATNTVAARSFPFYANYNNLNTIEFNASTSTQVQAKAMGGRVNVNGNYHEFSSDDLNFDITTDLETGITENASTMYYLYITETGARKKSTHYPYYRKDFAGCFYHPYNTWRCIGLAYNNSSSDISVYSSVDFPQNDEITVYDGTPDRGSTDTMIREFNTIYLNKSASILYETASTTGGTWTCYFPITASFFYRDSTTGSANICGFSLNAVGSDLTTGISLLTHNKQYNYDYCATTFDVYANATLTRSFLPGDVLRCHVNAATALTTSSDVKCHMKGTGKY